MAKIQCKKCKQVFDYVEGAGGIRDHQEITGHEGFKHIRSFKESLAYEFLAKNPKIRDF